MADSKAILIGIDGAQLEEYLLLDLQGEAPNINNLDIIESFIGGIVGTASEQATSSGPGWSTILTGVWADKHGIPSNNSQPVNAEIDSIFEYVDNNIPDAMVASIVNWSPINTGHFAPEMGFIPGIPGIVDFEQNGLPDDVAAATVADLVLAEAPDFTFVQLDEVDGVGHSFGFSDEYNDSLITADDQVGMILDAVEQREAENPDEDWLVIVTTDHGRDPLQGFDHGGQTTSERRTFIAANQDLGVFSDSVPATSVVPTILDHLNIPFDLVEDGLESGSVLLGAPDPIFPVLESIITPEDNAIRVPVDTDFVIQFSENIQAGEGNILIKRSTDDSVVETIDVSASEVTIDGDTVTINPVNDLLPETDYYIQIENGALGDGNNPFTGIIDNETWNFTTEADTVPPVIENLTPADNATNVAVDTNFVIEFNEDVQVGAGKIAIATDDTIVETIDVTSSQVIVEGDTVTINPNNNLTANTDYFVQVDEGAFRDTANTITLFTEDFEGLTLEPFVSPTEGGGDGTDFTTTPPEGWTQDNSTTPTGGPIEFFGWTFLDKNSWAASAGGQRRNEFTKGVGTVMVADPDEYDDADVDIDPDFYNAFIQTPAIDLTEIEANTAFLTFDSSWRPEDNQKANLTVSFDGGEPIELLRWTSDPNDPNFKPDESTNETLSIPLNNPEDASSGVLNFGVFEAGNDWWWAVDNILVQGSGETVSGNPFAGITDDTTWNFQTTNDLEPGEESLEILLVNDDGFEADGINVMFEALTEAGYNVTLVAPKEQQSGRGTLINVDQIFQPTEVVNFEENKWFVDGSPVVTTWAALDFILDGNEPDLVISGINEGANIGSNIVISSGTVSAASTAIQRGIPAIAVSAGTGSDEEKLAEAYDIGADFVVEMIQQLEENDTEQLLPDGVGLNVNIPTEFAEGVEEIQGVKFTALDEVSTLDLRFGELPETFGEGVGVLIDFNSPISPDEVTNINSEGEQFLAGAITVTPIDGDWSGSEEIRDSLSQRIEAVPENVTAEPLDILITNDDGFEAEGIKVLYETLTAAGHNVTLVAPKEQQSGKGTVLDVDAIFQPTEVVNFEENQWFVDGAPRTTTWAALDFVLDEKPDLVISGINEGENIGPGGAVSSGTVSAAVTALLRDVPAIAISAGIDFEDETLVDEAYEIGADFVTNLISQLQATQELDETILPEGTGLSINIPVRFPEGIEEIQGVKFTSTSDITPFDIDFGELPSGGAGLGFAPVELPPDADIEPNSEGGQFLSGFITVTPLDGTWNAPEALRDEVQDLILPLLTPTPQPNVLIGSAESDTLTGFLGDDEIIGNAGDDVLRGEGGRSSGGQAGGDDTISGGVGNDRIGGKGGNDELYGDEGDDLIWGDDGDDLIRGGLGDDVITGDNFSGGQGSDTFILAVGEGTDTIVDFEVGTDFIGLAEGLTFADLSFTGNSIISGEETLAILNGIDTTTLTESDFLSL